MQCSRKKLTISQLHTTFKQTVTCLLSTWEIIHNVPMSSVTHNVLTFSLPCDLLMKPLFVRAQNTADLQGLYKQLTTQASKCDSQLSTWQAEFEYHSNIYFTFHKRISRTGANECGDRRNVHMELVHWQLATKNILTLAHFTLYISTWEKKALSRALPTWIHQCTD